MEKIFVPSQIDLPIDRVFIVAATLSTFKGCRHLDVQIFRPGATEIGLSISTAPSGIRAIRCRASLNSISRLA